MMVVEKKKVLDVLKKSPLFTHVSEERVESILNESKIVDFDKKTLFLSEELEDSVYILIDGVVKSYQINESNGKEYIIFLFHPSDIFDIITFVDQREDCVLFETLERSKLLKISHGVLERWIEKEPKLNQNIISLLSKMFLQLEQNSTELALYDTFTRLSKLILKNITIKPLLPTSIGAKIRLKNLESLSHEELANLIGTAREVVSRHIRTLKEKKILETTKRRHHILNLQSLIDHCHPEL